MSAENSPAGDAYLFGDTDLAAARLRLLAEVFAASTREFLEQFVALDPTSVLDLGCGPGYTTRLLAEMFPRARVRGVDSSAHFVALARQGTENRVDFEIADVTRWLPEGPYDLIYCRYLLTHVVQLQAAVTLWGRHLLPSGSIAIEENDWIHTAEPAFAKYLGIVEAMLGAQGQRLYVGNMLDGLASGPLLVQKASEVVPIAASNRDAARMFLMNVHSWRQQPFVAQNYAAADLDLLVRDLEQLAGDDPRHSSITFGRRRLVLERVDA
jgi:trans-aconitate 2-methyltransferase